MVSGEMPHTTQCAYGEPGNWSLSTASARLTVLCGGSDQAMGDDMSSWVQLYFLGMRLLSLNYELVTSMLRSNGWATAYPSVDSASQPCWFLSGKVSETRFLAICSGLIVLWPRPDASRSTNPPCTWAHRPHERGPWRRGHAHRGSTVAHGRPGTTDIARDY